MLVTRQQIAAARSRLLAPRSIRDQDGCLAAIDQLGLVWAFTPGRETLPSLWEAMDTTSEQRRWEWMWGWKDAIAATRRAYYGKVVGAKPTFISLAWLGLVYALTGNTGDLNDDLDHLSSAVRLSDLARKLCDYLAENGPTGTRELVAQLTDGSPGMRRTLNKAMDQLDTGMLIVKSGNAGGSSIANVWDLFAHFLPEAVDAGTAISTRQAAQLLLRQYFVLTPAAPSAGLGGLFPWNEAHQRKAITRLKEAGELVTCEVDGKPGLMRADFHPEP